MSQKYGWGTVCKTVDAFSRTSGNRISLYKRTEVPKDGPATRCQVHVPSRLPVCGY
jgi:hypothetical protein